MSDCTDFKFNTQGKLLSTWSANFAVGCILTFCQFTKDSKKLTSDGENVVMALSGHAGATYTFKFNLKGKTASYIKLVAAPANPDAKHSISSAGAFSDHPGMSEKFVLGDWGKKRPGNQAYDQYNPDFDLQQYEMFPDERYPTDHTWEWVAPSNDDYVLIITSNCDVPMMDDVQSNIGKMRSVLPLP